MEFNSLRTVGNEGQINTTYLRSKQKILTSAVGQTIAAIIFGSYFDAFFRSEFSVILLNITLFNLLRFATSFEYHRVPVRILTLVYQVSTLLSGLGWAVLSLTTISEFGLESEPAIIALDISGGIAAAGSVTLSSNKKLAYAFIFSVLVPIIFGFLFFIKTPHITLAIVSSIYLGFLLFQARSQNQILMQLQIQLINASSLFKLSGNAIVVHEDGIITEINPAFAKLFETTNELANGLPVASFFCKDEVVSELKPNDRVGLSRNHNRFPVSIYEHAPESKGQRFRIISIFDLTQQKAAEQLAISNVQTENVKLIELNRNSTAKAANQSRFLADMSHEIRTPLNAIIGLTDMISKDPKASDVDRNLNILKSSADHLYRLLNDVLDVSKIDENKIELIRRPFSLREMVGKQIDLLMVKALESKTVLKVEIDPKAHLEINGDQTRLGQILLNLLSNSIKFTQNGVVYLRIQQTASDEKSIRLKFEVLDTGIGMSCEQMEKLFKAYTQTTDDTFSRFGGTGLGLNISQQLVKLMGGRIEVESELGKGSKFFFDIRLEKAPLYQLVTIHLKDPYVQENTAEINQLDRDYLSKLKILVAEDNSTNRLVIASILKNLKVEFDFAHDGTEVMPALERKDYDLILMDCHMPNMDGFETTEKIREGNILSKNGKPINIIALTASVRTEDRDRCLEVGMNSFIPKPVRALPLSKTILGLLNDAA